MTDPYDRILGFLDWSRRFFFHQLLMRFWPVNEMIELVSGMPARIFVSARIRAASRLKLFRKPISRTLRGTLTPGWSTERQRIWAAGQTNSCFSYKVFWRIYLISGLCPLARGSVVAWGAMPQAGRPRIRFPMRSQNISIDLIFPAALWPWSRLSL
jgi:hypothetical protein